MLIIHNGKHAAYCRLVWCRKLIIHNGKYASCEVKSGCVTYQWKASVNAHLVYFNWFYFHRAKMIFILRELTVKGRLAKKKRNLYVDARKKETWFC